MASIQLGSVRTSKGQHSIRKLQYWTKFRKCVQQTTLSFYFSPFSKQDTDCCWHAFVERERDCLLSLRLAVYFSTGHMKDPRVVTSFQRDSILCCPEAISCLRDLFIHKTACRGDAESAFLLSKTKRPVILLEGLPKDHLIESSSFFSLFCFLFCRCP